MLFPTPKERIARDGRADAVHERRSKSRRSPATHVDAERRAAATYNAYSMDGDVTAPLVYVNYGRPEDYEELERHGVSVKGAIVIVRYGGTWRGIKPKFAAEHGAVGCLIYSDPRDDGYCDAAVFPDGSDAATRTACSGAA